jgi:pyridoxal phosphate enzyme (YggS family)
MISENIAALRKRVADACARAKRDPKAVTIVAVSKGRSRQEIEETLACGITDIGENRVQEALSKFAGLQVASYKLQVKLHFIGHLQTNKVKDAVRIFDIIHSVDSLRLAQEIDRQAAKINKTQDIFIEVKTSPEVTKYGFSEEEIVEIIPEIMTYRNIRIKGLMSIAPVVDKPEAARPYFRILTNLRERITGLRLAPCNLQLSMGMTDDFEVAIEEGATMIRIGRAIFQ